MPLTAWPDGFAVVTTNVNSDPLSTLFGHSIDHLKSSAAPGDAQPATATTAARDTTARMFFMTFSSLAIGTEYNRDPKPESSFDPTRSRGGANVTRPRTPFPQSRAAP